MVTQRHEGLKQAMNVLSKLRDGGEGAVSEAVVAVNEPSVDRATTELVDLAGIVDATEFTQPAITEALKRADDRNPSILADAFRTALEGGMEVGVLEGVAENIEEAENSPEATANYAGNWMQLQQERMQSDDFRQKFDTWTQEDAMSVPPPFLGKFHRTSPTEISNRQENFGDNLENVYSEVGIGPASKYGKLPANLGKSPGYGEPGVVFSDAERNGAALTGRQKDLLAAHEAHHGLILPTYNFKQTLLRGFDSSVLPPTPGQGERKNSKDYITSGHELIARMGQLKNYFGMKEGEVFTAEHI